MLPVQRSRSTRALVAVVAGAATLLLSSCGDSAESTAPGAATAEASSFPISITHKLGTTEVEKAPTRIVALSDGDLDSLLALGVQPIGIAASAGDGGINEWARPELTGEPTVLEAGDNGFDVEAVLALDPDLILAGGDYYIKDEYQNLAATGVPVTAYESGPAEDSWQTTLRQVAKAIDRTPRAEDVIKDVETQVAAVKTENAPLVGKTFALTQMWEAGSIGVLRSADDAGVKMLNDFGLTLAPSTAALKGDEFAVQLSLEKLPALESDVLLTYFADPELQPALEANRLFQGLSVVKDGGFVPLTAGQFSALRVPTPLSVPYTITNVVPSLVKAVGATD